MAFKKTRVDLSFYVRYSNLLDSVNVVFTVFTENIFFPSFKMKLKNRKFVIKICKIFFKTKLNLRTIGDNFKIT
jgi:hypothetical protein